MINYNEERKHFVQWIKTKLSGEKLRFDEKTNAEIFIGANPFNRYTMGILYPAGVLEESEEEETVDLQTEDDSDVTSTLTTLTQRYQPPSLSPFYRLLEKENPYSHY